MVEKGISYSVSPETDDKGSTSINQGPDGNGGLGGELAGRPDEVDGSEGTDSVTDIVGTVGERGGGGGENLEEGVGVLGLVVVVAGAGVHLLDVTGEDGGLLLLGDDIDLDTVEEGSLDLLPDVLGLIPLADLGGGVHVAEAGGLGGLVRVARGGGAFDALLGLELLVGVGLDVVGWVGDAAALLLELLPGLVALVVVLDDGGVGGVGGNWSTAEEEWSLDDVEPAHLPVVHDELAVQPWEEEDDGEETNTDGCSHDDTDVLSWAPFLDISGCRSSSLPHDQH